MNKKLVGIVSVVVILVVGIVVFFVNSNGGSLNGDYYESAYEEKPYVVINGDSGYLLSDGGDKPAFSLDKKSKIMDFGIVKYKYTYDNDGSFTFNNRTYFKKDSSAYKQDLKKK